jgi:tetratricopeptide (TPR) repeat protein
MMLDPIAEYRSLLTAQESLSALDRAIDLAQRVARGGRVVDRQRWTSLIETDLDGKPAAARSVSARRARLVSCLLKSLPSRAERPDVPESQFALLIDTLLLVFHFAYFSLLPKAASDRTALLDAMDEFTDWLPNLPDRFQTKGLLHLERGEIEQATRAFNAALAATPSDQHDFMTRVQMVWSLLMEHHRVRDAFKCLTEISPRVTRLDYDEFQGLLNETFEAASRH